MNEFVRLHSNGPVAKLTLARPDKLNALTLPMVEALDAACGVLERSSEVRVVILASENAKAFCSGADIKEWGDLGAKEMWRTWTRIGHRVYDRLATLPQPTIAAVHGLAFGGGLELALACDLRIAATDSSFAMPEASVGAIPGWGGTRRLTRLIGPGHAKSLILRAARIDAATALAWGLVEEVVQASELSGRAGEIADEIARLSPDAVQLAKQLIDSEAGGLSAEAMAAGLALALPNGREGAQAFKAKRQPRFAD
jgi:enoyl-CoA hydratase